MRGAKGWLAVDLDAESIQLLKSCVDFKHPRPKMEFHVTLGFGVWEEDVTSLIGTDVILVTQLNCWDDKIQALTVNGVDRLDGGVAHITISMAEGVTAKQSNEMLKGQHQEQILELVLYGTIKFHSFK